MKFIGLIFIAILVPTSFAHACPDLSGRYEFVDAAWNGSVEIEQHSCTRLTLTRTRKVAASAKYPDGIWIDRKVLRTNGRPYVGFADSTLSARNRDEAFQTASWENKRLVIRQYLGASEKCGGIYFLNRGKCHVTKYILQREAGGDGLAWTQSGVWWKEGGRAVTDIYTLIRKSEAQSIPLVASN